MSRLVNILGLAVPILFFPAILGLHLLIGEEVTTPVLIEEFTYLMFLVPALTLVAVLRPRFRPAHGLWAVGVLAILEGLNMIGLDLVEVMGEMVFPWKPGADPGVWGRAVFMLFALGLGCLSFLHRVTLFRLLTVILSAAQIATVLLFHYVTVSWPMAGLEAYESGLARAAILRNGDFDALCGLQSRVCFIGGHTEAQAWAAREMAGYDSLARTLEDTEAGPAMFYSWIQFPSDPVDESVAMVSLFRPEAGADRVLVMADLSGGAQVYAKLRFGITILLIAFTETWLILTLFILARHGDWAWKGRWRPDRPRA